RRADLLALAQAEVRDRLLRALLHRVLARDRRQLLDDAVQQPRLLDGFAQADVHDHFLDARNLVRVLVAELLLQLRPDGLLVERAQTRRRNRQTGARVRAPRLFLLLGPLAALLFF